MQFSSSEFCLQVRNLSGGQISTVGLAVSYLLPTCQHLTVIFFCIGQLLIAMQYCYPAPFVIMDEVQLSKY